MAGSKKKGAKSKVGVEEQARLVEEANRALAAEKLRQEQEAEKTRIEDVRIEKQKVLQEKKETRHLEHQRSLEADYLAHRQKDIGRINVAVALQEDWEKFCACIPLPDVDNIAYLNTYLTTCKLDPTQEMIADPKDAMQPLLDECYKNEQVIQLLTAIHGRALEEGNEEKLKWVNSYKNTLRDNTIEKLNKFTLSFLHYADDYDDETAKSVVHHSSACPREIVIPAGPPFDHLPGLSAEPADLEDKAEQENTKTDTNLMSFGSMELMNKGPAETEVKPAEEPLNTKTVRFPFALENQDIPEMYFGIWVHTTQERAKSVEFEQIDFKVPKLPLALQSSRTCFRVLHTSFDFISSKIRLSGGPERPESKSKKKRKKQKSQRFVSVGGVINLEQLAVPAAPKTLKGWVMREHTLKSEQLFVQPYPHLQVEGKNDDTEEKQTSPLEISYRIPGFVLLKDGTPHFGCWNEKMNLWEEDGIEGMGYDPETRIVTLKLSALRPFAVIQPRALDYPYREWSLSPRAKDTAIIQVTGSRYQVKLEIVGGKCRLLAPNEEVLKPIFGKLLDPGVLLLRLARVGINLIPDDDDATFCRKPPKNELEPTLHDHLSMVSGMFEITGSSWNSSRGPSKCMFKIKLASSTSFEVVPANENSVHVEDQPPASPEDEVAQEETPNDGDDEKAGSDSDWEDDEDMKPEPDFPEWLQILCTTDKFVITQSTDMKFTEEIMDGQVRHTSLRRALSAYFNQQAVLDRTSVDVKASLLRADRDSLAMQQTVRRTLNMLRVFTFY